MAGDTQQDPQLDESDRYELKVKLRERRLWEAAAEKDGRPLAQWIRRELNKAAARQVDPPRE